MPKRFTAARVLLASLAIIFSALVAVIFYTAGNFYKCLDDFSGQVARGDSIEAKTGLERLKYFHELNNKFPPLVRDFVSKRFFKDAKYHQAVFDSMTGQHGKAVDDLKNESGYYAYQITGNAKWRIAQDVYKKALLWPLSPTFRKEQIQKAEEMASSTKDDYEKALRANPNNHEASWNYELMTIAGGAAMRGALQPKEGKIKIRLGLKGRGNKGDRGKGKDGGLGGEGTEDLGRSGDKKARPNPSERRPG